MLWATATSQATRPSSRSSYEPAARALAQQSSEMMAQTEREGLAEQLTNHHQPSHPVPSSAVATAVVVVARAHLERFSS